MSVRSRSTGGEGWFVDVVTATAEWIIRILTPIPFDRFALFLGRISAIVSLVLCILWVSGEDTENGYLGGLEPYSPDNKNVFSWHAVLMVAGVVCLSGWSMTAYRMTAFSLATARNLHVLFHLGAKVCLTLGVKAAWDYKDLDQGDDSPAYLVHMGSFHAMLGLVTTILLVQNDMIGSIVFLVPAMPARFRILYKPHHIFFGKTAYIVAMMTVISGITEKQTYIGCLESRPYRDQDVTNSYGKINEGCRIASGLGIMVVVALICNIFALQKPHGRVQSKENASDLSVSLAGDVMRSSELGPDAHRNIDINMSIDGFSDYRGSI